MKRKVNQKITSLKEALIIILIMFIILGFAIIKFGLQPEVPILACAGLLMFWGHFRGFTWDYINDSIKAGVEMAIIPIFIFILIGTMIGLWIKAGVIPTVMYFGFHALAGQFFIPSVFVVCSIVAVAVGSSITAVATVGIALLGIGSSMGANLALVAGAIVSGAIFGHETSPMGDSNNLAAAVSGSDLFDHIKNMMWVTLPSFVISLILFWLLGNSGHLDLTKINTTSAVLQQHFDISWWAIIPILIIFICAWRKLPVIPTLFINIAITVIMIFIEDQHQSVAALVNIVMKGFVAHTSNKSVNLLLTRGGISSMMALIIMVFTTLSLGEMLIKFGIIHTALNPLLKHLKTPKTLIAATVLSGLFINLTIGEQYISILLPGETFKDSFKKLGLSSVALSRAIENGGTPINYLIPWGVSGLFAASTLGVPVLTYLPFAFFAWLSPLVSILSGFTGIGLKQAKKDK